jgi:hypothetical protein
VNEPVTRSRQPREKAVLAQPRKHHFQRSIRVAGIDLGVEQRAPAHVANLQTASRTVGLINRHRKQKFFMVHSFIEGRLQSRRPSIHGQNASLKCCRHKVILQEYRPRFDLTST